MIVTDSRVARFVGERIDRIISPPFTCIGLEKSGQIVAGAVFNCFEGDDIELTIAANHGAITRGFLRAMGAYVRDQLGCYRVSMTTTQAEVIEMCERLGGEVEGRREISPGRFKYLLGITKDKWKF